MRFTRMAAIASGLTFACGAGATTSMTQTPPGSMHDPLLIDGFDPPAMPAGATRIVMPPVKNIQPGQEAMWCQWVAAPFEKDTDVLEITGAQSVGGHHAIMYATTAAAPLGTTRPCTDEDLTSVRYLGAIGGEGVTGAAGQLPPNVVYRIPKGFGLMANVHYVNYKAKPIDGQAVLDMKLAAKDESRVVASLFVNIDVEVDLLPNKTASMDVWCTLQDSLRMFWFGNHMHVLGTSAYTEVIRGDGTKEMLRNDPTWSPEFRFNPTFNRWSLDSPLILNKGDKLHTRCNWNNTNGNEIYFPSEMCAGFGFYIGGGVQIDCIKGEWGT